MPDWFSQEAFLGRVEKRGLAPSDSTKCRKSSVVPEIRAHLFGDMVLVRLEGVLTAAEQHLAQSLPAEKGRDLLKQVRTHPVETARPLMEAMVECITGVKVVSMHHDISTRT